MMFLWNRTCLESSHSTWEHTEPTKFGHMSTGTAHWLVELGWMRLTRSTQEHRLFPCWKTTFFIMQKAWALWPHLAGRVSEKASASLRILVSEQILIFREEKKFALKYLSNRSSSDPNLDYMARFRRVSSCTERNLPNWFFSDSNEFMLYNLVKDWLIDWLEKEEKNIVTCDSIKGIKTNRLRSFPVLAVNCFDSSVSKIMPRGSCSAGIH